MDANERDREVLATAEASDDVIRAASASLVCTSSGSESSEECIREQDRLLHSCPDSRLHSEEKKFPKKKKKKSREPHGRGEAARQAALVDSERLLALQSSSLPQLRSSASQPFMQRDGVSFQRQHLRRRFPFFRESLCPPTPHHANLFTGSEAADRDAVAYVAAHQRHCKVCASQGLHQWGREWHRLFTQESHSRSVVLCEEAEYFAALRRIFDDEHRAFAKELLVVRRCTEQHHRLATLFRAVADEEANSRAQAERGCMATLRAIARASRRTGREVGERVIQQQLASQAALESARAAALAEARWRASMGTAWEAQRWAVEQQEEVERTTVEIASDTVAQCVRLEFREQMEVLHHVQWRDAFEERLRITAHIVDTCTRSRHHTDDDERVERIRLKTLETQHIVAASARQLRRLVAEVMDEEACVRVRIEATALELLRVHSLLLAEERLSSAIEVALDQSVRDFSLAAAAGEESLLAIDPRRNLTLQFLEYLEAQRRKAMPRLSQLSLQAAVAFATEGPALPTEVYVGIASAVTDPLLSPLTLLEGGGVVEREFLRHLMATDANHSGDGDVVSASPAASASASPAQADRDGNGGVDHSNDEVVGSGEDSVSAQQVVHALRSRAARPSSEHEPAQHGIVVSDLSSLPCCALSNEFPTRIPESRPSTVQGLRSRIGSRLESRGLVRRTEVRTPLTPVNFGSADANGRDLL